ncbi:MAG: histidine kinase [Prevotella sp.]|nr:histidine kinase [Prevotella sp.]
MRLLKHITHRENLIYLAIWVVLLAAPLISLVATSIIDEKVEFGWNKILHIWALYLVYLVVFLFHNTLLAPLFVYKNKKKIYFIGVACLLALFVAYQCAHGPGPDRGEPKPMMHEMPPPERPHDPMPPPPNAGLEHLFSFVLVCMMLGINVGIKQMFKNEEDRKTMEELEKENLRQRLDYLKYQINPHFFMNTLNNIHALVDIDPEKSKEAIVLLSKIMRYVLYDGERNVIPIRHEVDFITSYISLMRLRYSSDVSVAFNVQEGLPDGEIPPLLLLTFVENAFKHGISYRQSSFVDIDIRESEGCFVFTCRNSKHPKPQNKIAEEGGVGLKNVRQRLALLYGKDYDLDIDDRDNEYSVVLKLNKLFVEK